MTACSDLRLRVFPATLFGLALLAFAAFAPGQVSASPQKYYCDCDPGDTDGANCLCHYSYTLRKSATKEFRGFCTYEAPTVNLHPYIHSDGNGVKSVSCTISFRIGKYSSTSCTNWSAFHKRTVNISLVCTNETDD